MTDVSNAALLQAYKDAIEANDDGIAELLKTVILELMGGEEPPMVTIGNDKVTFEPYKAVTTPLYVQSAEAVDVTADWTGIDPTTKEVTS